MADLSTKLSSKVPDPRVSHCDNNEMCKLGTHLQAETPKASTIFLRLFLPSPHRLEAQNNLSGYS